VTIYGLNNKAYKIYNMKIAFYSNQLGERGTEIALYDYAYFNKLLLNNDSIIIYNRNHAWNNSDVIHKFIKEFNVYGISTDGNVEELNDILSEQRCDIIYMILYGTQIKIPTVAKVCIHAVFTCIDQPFGHVYASIAPWTNNNNGRYAYVPHMINLPDTNETMRDVLNIPDSAIVYGRYGGFNEFNIEYVHKIVYNVAKNNLNIYFLFANTSKFCEPLVNIIHLDAIIDLTEKVKFINACDAMLWGRKNGEIFSCSMGEFSIKNKPIICTKIGDLGHVKLLGENAYWYDENNLEEILITFNKEESSKNDWNAYKEFTPERVMQKFKEVFIDIPSKPERLYPITFSIPECKFVKTIPIKNKLLSTIIPGERSTYTFRNEADYYNEYKSSMFATTTKKSGWDCMRHYEIVANGCIPYFPNIEECPTNTMALLPKDMLIEGNSLYAKLSRTNYRITVEDANNYVKLNTKLNNYFKKHLTTSAMASYVLDKSQHTCVENILFLSGSLFPDYLRCLMLIGFKELFGAKCHDYPRVSHLYKSQNINYTQLYGMGMSYSNLLEPALHDDNLDASIVEDLIGKKYDIVVYGSYHRGIPFYDVVSKIYRPSEIIMLCGEDIHECNHKDEFISKGHHVFVREL